MILIREYDVTWNPFSQSHAVIIDYLPDMPLNLCKFDRHFSMKKSFHQFYFRLNCPKISVTCYNKPICEKVHLKVVAQAIWGQSDVNNMMEQRDKLCVHVSLT